MKAILFIALAVAVSACSSLNTHGHLTDSTVQDYRSLSPTEFMQRKWYEEKRQPILEGVTAALRTASSYLSSSQGRVGAGEENWGPSKLFDDGTGVFWTAYYNDVNFGQLADPIVNFRKYCESTEGVFSTVSLLSQDLFSTNSNAPFVAYLSAYQRQMRNLSGAFKAVAITDSNEVVYSNLSNDEKRKIAERAGVGAYLQRKEQLDYWRAYSQRVYYSHVYDMIAAAGAFGSFQCIDKNGKSSWGVSILPFAVKSLTQNTAAMRISISVVENR